MLRDALKQAVEVAISTLVTTDRLPAAVLDVPVEISDTKSPEHGDYACNFAMVAAKRAGMNPRVLGEMLRDALGSESPSPSGSSWRGGQGGEADALLGSVEVAGPGFLNLRLRPEAIAAWVPKILAAKAFGHLDNPDPQRINVEFVSVNPNGPITIGSGRGAAFGSALSNVLQAAGNAVHREYYINDGVNSEQMRQFGYAVSSFFSNLLTNSELPDDLPYKGDYVRDTAAYAAQESTQTAQNLTLRWLLQEKYRCDVSIESVCKCVRQAKDIQDVTGEILQDDDSLPGVIFQSAVLLWNVFHRRPKATLDKKNIVSAILYISATWDGHGEDDIRSIEAFSRESFLAFKYFWPNVVDQRRAELLHSQPTFNPYDKFFSPTALEMAADLRKVLPAIKVNSPKGTTESERRDVLANVFRQFSQDRMIARQKSDLEDFGVHFDTWFSEQSLHDRGIVAERIEGLKSTGVADEEPYRTKLKLGKGGVIEETIREDQPNEDEGEEESTTHDSPSTAPQNTLWLRSTKFGDDMDRVLRRRDGRLTYIASDVAYHEDKLSRPENATKLITILGPDHHGYIGRLTAVMAALLRGPEDTPEANALALAQAREKLEVVIYQLVRFLKDGKPAPMRKRDGNIYELRDLIDELGRNLVPDGTKEEQRTTGRDVARFFYLMRSHDTTMDFDIDLATQQSDENPVFYAQYAHARICSVLRKASEAPSSFSRGDETSNDDQPSRDENEEGVGGGDATAYHLLTHPRELALVKKILDLPWEVDRIAKDYGVHRLTTYAVELARTYHHFYDACRVIQQDQPELTRARLALCQATKVALHATFELLGVSSPERLERRSESTPTA